MLKAGLIVEDCLLLRRQNGSRLYRSRVMLGVIGINGLGIDRLLLEKVWLWLSCAIGHRHIGWDAVMVLLWRDNNDCLGLLLGIGGGSR